MKKLITHVLVLISISLFGQNPQLLKDVFPGNNSGTIQNIVKTTGYVFFNEDDDDADADRSLFRTDGTGAGTIKLNLTYPGYVSTKAEMLTALGNKVVFAGDNFQNYGEIWASDGTQAGTVAIERFQPINNRVPVVEIKTMGSYSYYSVINKSGVDNLNHAYLKRTDGSAGGTSLVYDFSAFTGVPQVVFLTPVNNILYFIVYDAEGTGVDQLWRSDGTAAGTSMVYNFTTANFVESFIMPVGNTLYLMIGSIVGGVRQNTIWKSDGTTAGTVPVKLVGTGNTNTYPPFAVIGSTLYFAGVDGNGKELWQTDGTAAGTYMAADINPGAGSSNPLSFAVLNNTLYFSAVTPTSGGELWKYSSGVASLVKDINPGASGSGPGGLTVSNNTIIFNANNGVNGGELWITDGTAANTVLAADINPGAGNSVPNTFTGGNPVYFAANNGTNGFEVFKYDNTDGVSGVRKLYVNDNSTNGDIFTTAVGNNINPGTRAAPVATIAYAVSIAQPGDTIVVDAGTFTEQVTLDKNITINGAGKDLTFILKPAVTVPPPGAFTEQGLIQTVENIADVFISNLTITGDYTVGITPVILQGGGSIKNCRLQNGNQGVFIRVNPAAKTAVIENNIISAEYIAVNVEGTQLTASLINNDITVVNQGFSAGVFAGADFGSLLRFTATGNIFRNYVNQGIFINCSNPSINQNSFLGNAGFAIQRFGGATPAANCNWYGSPLAATVASKINGGVTYSPWLIDGTDNSLAVGFQSSVTCPVANSYYVNDNSQSGDVFTTAVGNNVNPGTSTAPFASLDYAISQVPVGATIFVDAGTFNLSSQLTINKSITILGSNYLVSPNDANTKTNYNGSRNAEAKITGAALVIGADNINLRGLRFSPLGSAISQNGDFSHVKVEKSYFDVVGAGSIINLQGSTGNPIVAFDFGISDNRFERTDLSNGNSINLGWVKSVWMDNNVFIESPVSGNPFRGFAARTVFNQKVESTVFSNNYVKKLQVGVLPTMIQDWTINNNVFDSCTTGINHAPANAVSSNVFIRSNTFTNVRVGRSILVRGGTNGGVNNYNIIDNLINQEVDGINGIVGMIQLDFPVTSNNGVVSVTGNKLNLGGNYANTGIPANCGIIVIGKHSNTTIAENELTFTAINAGVNGPGVLPPVPTGIFISTDGGAGSGPIPAGSVINITNNKINGFKSSIGLFDPTSTGLTSEVGYGYLTAGAQVNIHDNSFVNDSMSIDNGAISENINATCNFYNTNIPEVLITKISPETGDYLPWLVNGTDNEPSITGFQPVPGSCTGRVNKWYVNDLITTGDVFTSKEGDDVNGYGLSTSPFATITKALTEAQAGDTIYIDAGSYTTSNITLSKKITILGPNYNITPVDATRLDYNESRNEEAFINGATITIDANDIIIKGLAFDPGAKSAIIKSNNGLSYSNINIAKNAFLITSNLGAISIYGQNASPSSSTNYIIDDNAFGKMAGAAVQTITFNAVSGLTVSNNSFINDNASLASLQTAIHLGANSLVSDIMIVNNVIDAPFTGVFSNLIGNITLDNNKIYNSFTSTAVRDGTSTSNTITLKNNYYQINRSNDAFVVQLFGVSTSGTLKKVIVEGNTIDINATGFPNSPTGYLYAQCNVGIAAAEYTGRKNIININGDLTGYNGLFFTMRCNGKFNTVNIDSNELYLNAVNLPAASNAYGIVINLNTGSGNVPPSGSTISITHNKVSGFGRAVQFLGGTLPGVTCDIHNNSLINNRDLAIVNGNQISPAMNATCNWYGFTGAQSIAAKIFSTTPGAVTYSPWLTSGTDNDPAPGFQPVPASCNGTPVTVVFDSKTDIICNGGTSGAINITISGGVLPYTINWSKNSVPGYSSNEDLNNLGAGTYSVTITDALGSTVSLQNISITEPSLLTASTDGSGVSCFGGSNGAASVSANGGTGSYTYLWSNGATSQSISGLTAGTYNVTVTDANGCTANGSYQVTQPALLTATGSGTNVNCFNGTNGTASVSVNGGTAPYSYLWNNSATTSSINNLAAGAYSVTVTDANGCTTNGSYQVTQPTLLTAVATGTSTTCANSATVVASGGTAPYTYLWSNSATTQTISSLPAGTYNVTVTDANGCTATASCTVTAAEAFNPSASVVNVSCYNTLTGSITVTNANATAPFRFSIDGINFSTPQALPYTFSNLAAGTYTITVKDANGCTGFVTKTITQPAQLTVTQGTVQSTCYGLSTGSINVTVSGGTAAYSYQWSGPNGYSSTQLNISNLAMGNYTLTVTDSKNCTATLLVNVPGYNQITISPVIHNVSCKGGSDGSIILNTSGGTGNFNYSWNTGQTTANIFNLIKGSNYKVTITDNGSGCTFVQTLAISEPDSSLTIKVDSTTEVLGCNTLAKLYATAAGGTRPYQFKYGNLPYQASTVFTGLTQRTDTLWVKDANGCVAFKAGVSIIDKGGDEYETCNGNNNNARQRACTISLGANIVSRIGKSTDADWFIFTITSSGSYTVNFVHPSPAILYAVTPGTGSTPVLTGSTATSRTYNLTPGTYYVNVYGATNADYSLTCYLLSVNSALLTRSAKSDEQMKPEAALISELRTTVFPNPHQGAFGIKIASAQDGIAVVEVLNAAGQLVAEKRQAVNKGGVSIVNFTNMNHNILFYRVRIGSETSTGKIIGPN